MTGKFGAYVELATAMMFVGTSVIVGKLVVASFPIFLANAMRLAVGLTVLAIATSRNRAELRTLRRRDLAILFAQALTGAFLFYVLLFYGLKFIGAAESGIITSTTPAFTAIISWLFLRERPTWNVGTGVVLAIAGIMTINITGQEAGSYHGAAPLLGSLLVIGAVISEALFTIFSKLGTYRVTPLTMSAVVTCFGLIVFLPFALYEAISFDFAAVPPLQYAPLVYHGISANVIAYLLWFRGVSKVSASTAAVFTGVMPISAVLLSYLILGEQFSWSHLVGVVCVLAAIGLISREQPQSEDLVEQA